MNPGYERAAQKLGLRQRAYQSAFAEGGPAHAALADLADYSKAFTPDVEGLSDGALREMHGRRQAFFRIINHLKLPPSDLEAVYHTALMRAASRLQTTGAEE